MSVKGALLLTSLVVSAIALGQAPPAPSPAKRAIEERKAIYTLIGANFRPLAEQLQGRGALADAEARKRAERLAFLAMLSADAFAEVSNGGEAVTRAKGEIWAQRPDFNKSVEAFVAHARTLSQVVAAEGVGSDQFKSAAAAVAEDCKACHDRYRLK